MTDAELKKMTKKDLIEEIKELHEGREKQFELLLEHKGKANSLMQHLDHLALYTKMRSFVMDALRAEDTEDHKMWNHMLGGKNVAYNEIHALVLNIIKIHEEQS